MKYLTLPTKIFLFWYPESLVVQIRIWKNLILYLEEDLSVGLMWRLLFTPLFHDSSFVGRLLSFFFRSFRIVLGFCTFIAVTLGIIALSLAWFTLPFWAFYLTGTLGWVVKMSLFAGVVLFINHIISHPHKKLWQIKSASEIWQCSFIGRSNVDLTKLLRKQEIRNFLLHIEQTPENFIDFPNPEIVQMEEKTWGIGKQLQLAYLLPEHFFVGFLLAVPDIESRLLKMNLSPKNLMDALEFNKRKNILWRVYLFWDEDFRIHHLKGVNRGWVGVPTPTLDSVSEDLTRSAIHNKFPDFIGRQNVVAQVINTVSLEKGRNIVLVGESGSGRGALVRYLAKLIISGDAPASLATKRLVALDFTKLVVGIGSQGELAERLKNIFDEATYSGNIVIFVPEVQNFGIGEAGSQFNLYSLILPFIESGETQFITTTEPGNYVKILEKDAPFAHLFTKIELPPATEDDTLEILKNYSINAERYRKVKTSVLALSEIARLSARYIHDRVLPDSALHVFEACLGEAENGWVNKKIVEDVMESQVKIPILEVEKEIKEEVLNLEEIIHKSFIDQEEAVTAVASTLRRAAANLQDKGRPIGSFLFVGPTGVGKSELAKILSKTYFKGRGNFARFDMSEYQAVDAIDKLLGRSGEEGTLTEIIRQNPYSLILLDEFEKADPKILNLFLQVLEDGRLTSGSGKTVDFTDCIIIATSNAASLSIAKAVGEGRQLKEVEGTVKNEILQIFRPELVNRFDSVVLFKPLASEDLQKIVRLKLIDLQNKLREQGFMVEFDEGLVKNLAEKGYNPVLGARPLRRLIQDTLESKFSILILEGKLPKGEKFVADEKLLQ